MRAVVLGWIFSGLLVAQAQAAVRSYDLVLDEKTVNFTGKNVEALAINGSIPAPTLEATEGDTLEIHVENRMEVETSLHWHGLLVPNDQDGVPYMTTPPVLAHSKATYRFPLKHAGTYWYHAHSGLQEQRGLFGGIVIHPQTVHNTAMPYVTSGELGALAKPDELLVLWSDWTDENPDEVLRHLKSDGDYYGFKKGSTVSWWGGAKHGGSALHNLLKGAWDRMGPMDVSDVGYDRFLVNGKEQVQNKAIKAGQKVRMRMVNASASSYMEVVFAGGAMTVLAADGVPVQPYTTDRLQMTMAENYDIEITLPEGGAYELRASSIDGTGYASYLLGEGALHFAPTFPRPDLYADMMDMSDMSDEQKYAMNMSGVDYSKLKATHKTEFSKDAPRRDITLRLTGNMERYVWSFDDKLLDEADLIRIKKGEVVRFHLINDSMMEHPLHLHGHFFRVLNGQGEYSPLKHTVNVPPMGAVDIEFAANEEKDWFFHCHNLYHMSSGMARVVHYQKDDEPHHGGMNHSGMGNMKHGDGWFPWGEVSLLSNMGEGNFTLSSARTIFELEAKADGDGRYEVSPRYVRPLGLYGSAFLGTESRKEETDEPSETVGIAGFTYTLPMMIDVEARLDSEKRARLEFSSDLRLAERVSFDWRWNTDKEYGVNTRFILDESAALRVGYDSDYGFGGGVVWKF